MDKIWTLAVGLVIFIIMSFLFYRTMRSYVREEYGKKWLTIWGNKMYFWQSLIFVSGASTIVIVFLLKWANVLSF